MRAGVPIRTVVPAILVLLLSAAVVRADVRVEISNAAADIEGKIAVDVTLQGGGAAIGGFQNDIIFDNNAVSLDSPPDCRINPAIGVRPLGSGDGVTTCYEDTTIGPCKTLVRSATTCDAELGPGRGCPTEDPRYSRLRVIVAAIETQNSNSISDGVAYTCTFTVVSPELLPVQLFATNVVVSDTRGRRLQSSGVHGGVCVDEEGSRRCATSGDLSARCALDFECASGNCDVCCDHQFNGICGPPRTPTPTPPETPTRTRRPTNTATNTRTPVATWTSSETPTVTNTPTPKSPGDPCFSSFECASNLACNVAAGVCCTSVNCPDGMACNVPGFEGYCVRGVTPTPVIFNEAVIEVGSATPGVDGFAEITVFLRSDGGGIVGMQNDILFDNTVLSLEEADCVIAPAIGLFPDGPEATSCFDDTSIGPCKSHFKNVEHCGTDPLPGICPQSAAPNLSVARSIVAAVGVLNNNPIPPGPLYTCRFRVLDSNRLPVALQNINVVVSGVANFGPQSTGLGGRIDPPPVPPGSLGARCSRREECDSRNCIDGVCCSQASCGADESCAVNGSRGDCTPKRGQGEGCDLGTDCDSGNCDLHRDSANSVFRGACGAARVSTPLPGECERGRDCDSGNCVDRFCCAEGECSEGEFCNTGECALPAEPGAPCTADEQCALGLCVDGACCVTGSCAEGESCAVFAAEGVCREPFRLGSECRLDEQCPTGHCTNGVCCVSETCPHGMFCSRVVAPGECVLFGGSEPGKPDDEGEPTAPPGGQPTAAAATPTLPSAPPTFTSQPTPSATVGVNAFGDDDDGCNLSQGGANDGTLRWLTLALFVLLAWRRSAHCGGDARRQPQ